MSGTGLFATPENRDSKKILLKELNLKNDSKLISFMQRLLLAFSPADVQYFVPE